MSQAGMVSVILPVYNQADHIGPAVEEFLEALAGLERPLEMLLVVNGPRRDDSLAVCRALEERHGPVRTLVSDKGGWGLAVRLGLAQAKGELLCYTNSARTTGEELARILTYACALPPLALKASRKGRDSWLRRLGSVVYNFECRLLFDLPVWDVNGTPKVFPRSFTGLLHLTRNDDLIDLEFAALCRRHEYPIIEVPTLAGDRHGGNSTTNYGSAVRMYRGAWRMWRNWGRVR